jgi:uncharacterized damage-inducible protein DinB
MTWTELLKSQAEAAYASAEGLLKMVADDDLGWKPETGENWMTVGTLVRHIADACGGACKGFVTGDWGMPADFDPSKLPPSDMLPPAEAMPTIDSVEEALRLLAEDKKTALAMIDEAGEDALANRMASAPWDPREMPLGQRLFQMIGHLETHKAQLFYYLKLQGKPVNTVHLWSG